jgi:hypothetical protein
MRQRTKHMILTMDIDSVCPLQTSDFQAYMFVWLQSPDAYECLTSVAIAS